MKLSSLLRYAEAAYNRFGDLECYIDNETDEDFVLELSELICEVDDNGEKHILLTSYDVAFTELTLVK